MRLLNRTTLQHANWIVAPGILLRDGLCFGGLCDDDGVDEEDVDTLVDWMMKM